MKGKTKAIVFLDRDGTINEEVGYLADPNHLRLLPGAAEGIRLLNQARIAVVVVTNQSGLARGFFDQKTLSLIHEKLKDLLAREGAWLDGLYYCPHHPKEGCLCRKPKPGLVYQAAQDLGLDLSRTFVVGDREGDLLLARNIGGEGILVRTGYGQREYERLRKEGRQGFVFADDLLAAAQIILKKLGL